MFDLEAEPAPAAEFRALLALAMQSRTSQEDAGNLSGDFLLGCPDLLGVYVPAEVEAATSMAQLAPAHAGEIQALVAAQGQLWAELAQVNEDAVAWLAQQLGVSDRSKLYQRVQRQSQHPSAPTYPAARWVIDPPFAAFIDRVASLAGRASVLRRSLDSALHRRMADLLQQAAGAVPLDQLLAALEPVTDSMFTLHRQGIPQLDGSAASLLAVLREVLTARAAQAAAESASQLRALGSLIGDLLALDGALLQQLADAQPTAALADVVDRQLAAWAGAGREFLLHWAVSHRGNPLLDQAASAQQALRQLAEAVNVGQ